MICWQENGQAFESVWWSERQAKAPAKVVLADDTLSADKAYRLACEGTALLWRGDYQNAKQLMQALARRLDKSKGRKKEKTNSASQQPAQLFHTHRQAQAQRANVLHKILIQVAPGWTISLRRAPDAGSALKQVIEFEADTEGRGFVLSLRDLLGIIGAYEWFKKGVEIPALGAAPNNRVHAEYGVYSPVRGEYLDLVANAPLPPISGKSTAFDIGTGTGVVAAILARRGVDQIVATELSPRALRCARANIERLGLAGQIQLRECDLFPQGKANLIVCNPPWLPAKATSSIEHSVYDPDSQMLKGFLKGLKDHLEVSGEAWLIISDLAEHLGLRAKGWLEREISDNHLRVIDVMQCKPNHPKAKNQLDPLAVARAQEITSLWRLGYA